MALDHFKIYGNIPMSGMQKHSNIERDKSERIKTKDFYNQLENSCNKQDKKNGCRVDTVEFSNRKTADSKTKIIKNSLETAKKQIVQEMSMEQKNQSEKFLRIKQQVQTGIYKIDAASIAEKLIKPSDK